MNFFPIFSVLLALWAGSISVLAISAPVIVAASVTGNDGFGRLTLKATVKPNGGLTKVKFSYGLEGVSKYETTTAEAAITGDSDQEGKGVVVSTAVTGLIGGKKYRFKVTASNAAGEISKTEFNFPDVIKAYLPLIIAEPAKVISGTKAIVAATVTGNGSENYTLEFVYGTSAANLDQTVSGGAIGKDMVGQKIAVTLGDMESTGKPLLARDTEYFYKIVLSLDGEEKDKLPRVPLPGGATTFSFKTTNHAPVTKDITVVLLDLNPAVISVLKNNEKDADGDSLRLGAIVLKPSHGAAVIRGKTIVYTPGSDFTGTDLFSYSVEDGREGTADGTVIIRSARAAVKGQQSALITDSKGRTVGIARLQVGTNGIFSGKVQIAGKSYQVIGEFDVEGRFHGEGYGGDGMIAIDLSVALSSAGSILSGVFGGGEWNSSKSLTPISSEKQVALAGRYTLELKPDAAAAVSPADADLSGTTITDTTSTSTAAAAGWAVIKMNESGEARIKGKTSDGESFSTHAYLGGTTVAPTLSFYTSRDRDELSSILTLGDSAVTGNVVVSRRGDDQTIVVDGAPYHPPQERGRVLETDTNEGKFGTLTINGADSTAVTHTLHFSKDNKIEVLNPSGDGLGLKIDDDTLRFTGKIRPGDLTDDREKISGVFIQSKGTGRGLVRGKDGVRRIEITLPAITSGTTQ